MEENELYYDILKGMDINSTKVPKEPNGFKTETIKGLFYNKKFVNLQHNFMYYAVIYNDFELFKWLYLKEINDFDEIMELTTKFQNLEMTKFLFERGYRGQHMFASPIENTDWDTIKFLLGTGEYEINEYEMGKIQNVELLKFLLPFYNESGYDIHIIYHIIQNEKINEQDTQELIETLINFDSFRFQLRLENIYSSIRFRKYNVANWILSKGTSIETTNVESECFGMTTEGALWLNKNGFPCYPIFREAIFNDDLETIRALIDNGYFFEHTKYDSPPTDIEVLKYLESKGIMPSSPFELEKYRFRDVDTIKKIDFIQILQWMQSNNFEITVSDFSMITSTNDLPFISNLYSNLKHLDFSNFRFFNTLFYNRSDNEEEILPVIRFLLEQKLSFATRDMCTALRRGYFNIVKLLEEFRSTNFKLFREDTESELEGDFDTESDDEGEILATDNTFEDGFMKNVLEYSIQIGNLEFVKYFIEKGHSVEGNPLEWTQEETQEESKHLQGSILDPNASRLGSRDRCLQGKILSYASSFDHLEILKYLISEFKWDDLPPLDVRDTVENNNFDVIELLINFKFIDNIMDYATSIEMLELLYNCGYTPTVKSFEISIDCNNLAIIKWLITKGNVKPTLDTLLYSIHADASFPIVKYLSQFVEFDSSIANDIYRHNVNYLIIEFFHSKGIKCPRGRFKNLGKKASELCKNDNPIISPVLFNTLVNPRETICMICYDQMDLDSKICVFKCRHFVCEECYLDIQECVLKCKELF